MERKYLYTKEKIDFEFYQNAQDFIVDEIAAKKWSKKGNFLILHVKKVELTTWDMVAAFAQYLKIEPQKIGYAGLKDKHATTTQYISIEQKYEKELKKFSHPNIEILSITRDNNSIQMGDLAGNCFKINLYGIDPIKAGKIEKLARKIEKNGMANYFGFQRFGRDADAITQAKEMIDGELHISDTKLKNFLISVYQSDLFNRWLATRVELSDTSFKLLEGDVYKTLDGKLTTPKQIPLKEFEARKLFPTGLLCGRGVFRSIADAREIEKKFDDEFLSEKGLRREALVYPKIVNFHYKKKFSCIEFSFELPKGSYATVFLENIANKNFTATDLKKG